MGNLTRNQVVGIVALLAILTSVVLLSVLRAAQSATTSGIALRDAFPQAPAAPPPVRPSDGAPAAFAPAPTNTAAPPPAAVEEIVVHVAGAVRKPGVYHLAPGARNADALKAAGGPTERANTDAVNLAARVEDGTQIYFPTREEHPSGGAAPASVSATTSTSRRKSASASTTGASSGSKSHDRGSKPGKLTDPGQGQININTASAEELQRLPGIGPSMAQRIIDYRTENHGFQSAEDLTQVSGIGEKKFEKLQPFIKVK